MPRYHVLASAVLSLALLSACAKSASNSRLSSSDESTPAQTTPMSGIETVRKDLQDYIRSQHGEAPPAQNNVMSWVTNKDLQKISITKETVYKSEENNTDPARFSKGSLILQSKTAITDDLSLMMRGKMIFLSDRDSETSFEQGASTVCEVSKSTMKTLPPGSFNLTQLDVARSSDVNMIEMKWTDHSGNSIFTRCLSRQNLKLGDLRWALHNYFVISVAR